MYNLQLTIYNENKVVGHVETSEFFILSTFSAQRNLK